MIPQNIRQYRPWRYRRRWGWGRIVRWLIFAVVMIAFVFVLNMPASETKTTLTIIFTVVIVVLAIIQLSLLYYFLNKRSSERSRRSGITVAEVRRRRHLAAMRREGKVKFCIKCGEELLQDAAFCEFCGAKQE